MIGDAFIRIGLSASARSSPTTAVAPRSTASAPACAPAPVARTSPLAAARAAPSSRCSTSPGPDALAKANRLTRGADYRRVSRRGLRSAGTHLVTHIVFTDEGRPARFGFIVTRAVGGAAVLRGEAPPQAICAEALPDVRVGRGHCDPRPSVSCGLHSRNCVQQVRRGLKRQALSTSSSRRPSGACAVSVLPATSYGTARLASGGLRTVPLLLVQRRNRLSDRLPRDDLPYVRRCVPVLPLLLGLRRGRRAAARPRERIVQALARIARCHPWAEGGVDDVRPHQNFRYDLTPRGFVVPRRKGLTLGHPGQHSCSESRFVIEIILVAWHWVFTHIGLTHDSGLGLGAGDRRRGDRGAVAIFPLTVKQIKSQRRSWRLRPRCARSRRSTRARRISSPVRR